MDLLDPRPVIRSIQYSKISAFFFNYRLGVSEKVIYKDMHQMDNKTCRLTIEKHGLGWPAHLWIIETHILSSSQINERQPRGREDSHKFTIDS